MAISERTRQLLERVGAIKGLKIVTWHGMFAYGNFDMEDSRILTTKAKTLDRLWRMESMVKVVVRQFSDEINTQCEGQCLCDSRITKTIYGFIVKDGIEKISSADMERAHNTKDGRRIDPEPGVIFA